MLWIVQHITGNHLMGSERWLALSYAELNRLILGLPYQSSICVSIFSQTLASSLMCSLKIMRRKLQPWLFNYPALPNLAIILIIQMSHLLHSRPVHSEQEKRCEPNYFFVSLNCIERMRFFDLILWFSVFSITDEQYKSAMMYAMWATILVQSSLD